MTRLEEIEEKMVSQETVDHYGIAATLLGMVKSLQSMVDTNCPCCAQDSECLDVCTLEEDDPHDYDEIAFKRATLKKIGVL